MKYIKRCKNIWPYILGYILWAVSFRVTPLFYDMWVMKHDYLIRGSNIFGVLKAVFFTGGCWKNARYVCNIINIYFVSYEWIFDFVMPLAFVLSIYCLQKIINIENRWFTVLLGMGLFLCVSGGVVANCYSYSYVLYLLPVLFFSIFMYLMNRYEKNEMLFDKWYKKILFIMLIYLNACFLEHVSCTFTVIIIGYTIYYWCFLKRKDWLLIIGSCVSLIQTLYMNLFLIVKQTRPLADDGEEIFNIIARNFRVLILETWTANIVVIISFLIVLTIMMRKKKIWFVFDAVLTLAYIIWVALIQTHGGYDTASYQLPYDIEVAYVSEELWPLWAILYVGINLIVLYQIYLISVKTAIIYFAGGCTTVPILVTPNTGWRISSFYLFMIILATTMMVQQVEMNKKSSKTVLVCGCLLVFILGLIGYFPRIIRINTTRIETFDRVEETISLQKEGKWDISNDVLVLPHYEFKDVINEGRPDANSYYMWTFAYTYGLDKDTMILTE